MSYPRLLTSSGRTSWTATATPRSTARVDAANSSPATTVSTFCSMTAGGWRGRSAPNLTTARCGRRRSRVTRLSRQRCSIGSTRCRRRVEASLDRSRRAAEALAPCLALPPLPSQPERTHELAPMQARPSSGQGPPTVPPHPLTAVSSRALSGLGADLGRAATVRHVWLLSDPTPHEVVSRAQH